jgi:hypothetical protein
MAISSLLIRETDFQTAFQDAAAMDRNGIRFGSIEKLGPNRAHRVRRPPIFGHF